MKLDRVTVVLRGKVYRGPGFSGKVFSSNRILERTFMPRARLDGVPLLLALLTLISLAGLGCEAVQERISPSTPTRPASTSTPTPVLQETPGATVSSASPTPLFPDTTPVATGLLLPVTIKAEPSDLPEYDRRSWRHWTDEDKDCQNARQEVLIAESTVAVTYESNDQCRVASGRWRGPYTGKTEDDPGSLDVDHMVPLENAHRSGAWSWDKERKRDYANYLGYENHLIATTSSANRSKGSKGPEEWRPPLEAYWCIYAMDWVAIKDEWGLSVTRPEYLALSEMLATCEPAVLLQPREGTTPPPPRPTDPPSLPTDLRYDPFGPDRDCDDFDTYEKALAFFLAAGGPGADPHKLDVDDDGEPCESLPGGPSAMGSPPHPGEATALQKMRAWLVPSQPADCPDTGRPASADSNLTGSFAGDPTATGCPTVPPPLPTIAHTPAATVAPTPTSSRSLTPTPIPSPTPVPITPQQSAAPEVSCSNFSHWQDAQEFFLLRGGPESDPHGLDLDGDGIACQSLQGAPPAVIAPAATATPLPVAIPEPTPVLPAFAGLPFDPAGPDRDCGDFSSWWDAQNFYLAAGGPLADSHGLDRNRDGTACESLVGAPKDDPAPSAREDETPPQHDGFEDRNCSDFSTWREAQDFFESEGGPENDPHRLDGNRDGEACESLPGAPK